MQVTFKRAQTIGNRTYQAGKQMVSRTLAGNQKFKHLVAMGQIVIHTNDSDTQTTQAEKDKYNAAKAEAARHTTMLYRAEKAGNTK